MSKRTTRGARESRPRHSAKEPRSAVEEVLAEGRLTSMRCRESRRCSVTSRRRMPSSSAARQAPTSSPGRKLGVDRVAQAAIAQRGRDPRGAMILREQPGANRVRAVCSAATRSRHDVRPLPPRQERDLGGPDRDPSAPPRSATRTLPVRARRAPDEGGSSRPMARAVGVPADTRVQIGPPAGAPEAGGWNRQAARTPRRRGSSPRSSVSKCPQTSLV